MFDSSEIELQLINDAPQYFAAKPPPRRSRCPIFSYPLSVQLIFLNEVTERFAYYGNRAILTLFLTHIGVSEAVMVFSLFSALAYTMPFLGGHIADAWIGRYWTILLFSGIYFVGSLGLALAANPTLWDSAKNPIWVYVSLFLTSVGTGGIKPCVSTFGADQLFAKQNFDAVSSYLECYYNGKDSNMSYHDNLSSDSSPTLSPASSTGPSHNNSANTSNTNFSNSGIISLLPLPSQDDTNTDNQSTVNSEHDNNINEFSRQKQSPPLQQPSSAISTESFFFLFYLTINIGSTAATIIIPLVRTRVSYFWAFLLPALLMLVSIVCLLVGQFWSMFYCVPADSSLLTSLGVMLYRIWKRRSFAQKLFFVPVDLTGNSSDIQSNESKSIASYPNPNYTIVALNVHQFTRYIHANYPSVIHYLYARNKDDIIEYQRPSWLVDLPTCPFDPQQQNMLANSNKQQPHQHSQMYSATVPDSTHQPLAILSQCCSPQCQCGCSCGKQQIISQDKKSAKTNHHITSPTHSTHSDASFSSSISSSSSTPSTASRRGPCETRDTTSLDSPVSLEKSSLLSEANASQISGGISTQCLCACSSVYSTPETTSGVPIITMYPSLFDYDDASIPSQSDEQTIQSSQKNTFWCCLPIFSQFGQLFTSCNLAVDEYTILDYITTNARDKAQIDLSDVDLPLIWSQYQSTHFVSQTPLKQAVDIIQNEQLLQNSFQKSSHNEPLQQLASEEYHHNSSNSHSYDIDALSKRAIPSTRVISYSSIKYNIQSQIVQGFRVVLILLPVLATLPLFWCLMNQQGSTWMLQAQDMNLEVSIGRLSFHVDPEQMSVLNPIFLFILLPSFEILMRLFKQIRDDITDQRYEQVGSSQQEQQQQQQQPQASQDDENHDDLNNIVAEQQSKPNKQASLAMWLTPLNKMMLGMYCAGIAYLFAAFADFLIEQYPPRTVSVLWQVPQYFFVTVAEVLISVTGLYFVFEMAPNNMKSFVNALLLFSSAVGDLITGTTSGIFDALHFSRKQVFLGSAVGIVINSIFVYMVQRMFGKLYKY